MGNPGEGGNLNHFDNSEKTIILDITPRILSKDEHARIILKTVGVFDFPVLIFE